jgi:hypothetical protein
MAQSWVLGLSHMARCTAWLELFQSANNTTNGWYSTASLHLGEDGAIVWSGCTIIHISQWAASVMVNERGSVTAFLNQTNLLAETIGPLITHNLEKPLGFMFCTDIGILPGLAAGFTRIHMQIGTRARLYISLACQHHPHCDSSR